MLEYFYHQFHDQLSEHDGHKLTVRNELTPNSLSFVASFLLSKCQSPSRIFDKPNVLWSTLIDRFG